MYGPRSHDDDRGSQLHVDAHGPTRRRPWSYTSTPMVLHVDTQGPTRRHPWSYTSTPKVLHVDAHGPTCRHPWSYTSTPKVLHVDTQGPNVDTHGLQDYIDAHDPPHMSTPMVHSSGLSVVTRTSLLPSRRFDVLTIPPNSTRWSSAERRSSFGFPPNNAPKESRHFGYAIPHLWTKTLQIEKSR